MIRITADNEKNMVNQLTRKHTQLTFTYSKSPIVTLEVGVKYVQSGQ